MKVLRVALTDVPDRLNPYESNTLHIHTVMWSIYEPLFDIGEDTHLRPRLAERWDVSADGLTYVFRLRRGVTFQPSGVEFTARSVVDNLQQVNRRTSFRERILYDLIDLSGVKEEDNYTVRIQLKYPKPELLFLALMTWPNQEPNKPLEGTGPFYFEQANDREIVLAQNRAYLPQPAKLDRIIFTATPPARLVNALADDLIDFVRDVDPESVLDALGNPALQTSRVRPHGLHYLGFNLGSTLFAKREVRRAFRDTIDFVEIESDTGLEPAKGPLHPGVDAYDPTLPTPQQCRADARRALRLACRDSEITLLYNENSYYGLELANRIADDLSKAGVAVRREPKKSSSELLKAIKERGHGEKDHYVLFYNWYSILPAAEIFLRPLFESGMPDNLTGYKDQDFDRLLALARDPGISPKQRIERYRRAQEHVVDDVPAISLGHSRVRHSVHRTRVQGLDLNVQSFPVDRYVGVDVL
jgi:peptide/nickel transport system substrate-binding protein